MTEGSNGNIGSANITQDLSLGTDVQAESNTKEVTPISTEQNENPEEVLAIAHR